MFNWHGPLRVQVHIIHIVQVLERAASIFLSSRHIEALRCRRKTLSTLPGNGLVGREGEPGRNEGRRPLLLAVRSLRPRDNFTLGFSYFSLSLRTL